MVTIGNECYLRSILFLSDGGRYITKKITQRELTKTGCSLDELLRDEKFKKKVKHECRHPVQKGILFPVCGQTDVDKWDIQMLIGIILILFRKDLNSDDRQSLREIKRLRSDLAHRPSASLTSEEYNDFITDLNRYIATLASQFEKSVQDKCSQLFKEYESCPLEVKSTIEDLNKLKDTDTLISRIVDKIEGSKIHLTSTIQEAASNIQQKVTSTSLESQTNIVNAVREMLEEKLQTEPFKKARSVLNLRLMLGGDDTVVNLADKIVAKVIDEAKKGREILLTSRN